MEQSGIFRKALFGGFEQKAVLNYIEQLEKEKAGILSRLETCLAREEECRKTEEQMALMRQELAEKEAEIISLNRKNEQLTLQLSEKLESIQRRECELEFLQEQADGLLEKSELYNDVSGKIGDTLLRAQATAERMVEQAKKDQLNIRSQTTEMISSAMEELDILRANLVEVRSQIGDSLETLDLKVSGLADTIDAAQRTLAGKRTFLNNVQKFEEAVGIKKTAQPETEELPESAN